MSRPQYSPRARQDLLELWLRIAEASSVERADAYLAELEQACNRLGANPRLGRSGKEWGAGVCSFSFGNDVVV